MYSLSRSLYRELTPMLSSSVASRHNSDDRQYLLMACEEAMQRLVLTPDFYARPVRSLFCQIRHLFPIHAQQEARQIVKRHVDAGRILADQLEASMRRECDAFTRKGTPCRREARAGRRYCPSHRHLDEPVVPGEAFLPPASDTWARGRAL
jgi:hypothetical protein